MNEHNQEGNSEQKEDAFSSLTFSHFSIPSDRHIERNEDVVVVDQRGLAAVFDGVGGHDDGHIAAQAAAQYLLRYWQKRYQNQLFANFVTDISSAVNTAMSDLILNINEEVKKAGLQYIQAVGITPLNGNGPATLAAIAFLYKEMQEEALVVTYAYVGDCRVYLLRPGNDLVCLTEDDGLLSLLLYDGKLSKEDVRRIDQATDIAQLSETQQEYFLKRNKITQALGWEKSLNLHVHHMTLSPQDCLLLCTDGVHDNLTDREIETLLQQEYNAEMLVTQAFQRSCQSKEQNIRAKSDDISAIILAYKEPGS